MLPQMAFVMIRRFSVFSFVCDCTYVCLCLCVHECRSLQRPEVPDPHGAGVIGGCMLPNVGSGT